MKIIWKRLVILFIVSFLQMELVCAFGASVGVIYPQLRDPYSKVFETIIDGIEQEMDETVDRYELGAGNNIDALDREIGKQDNKLLLALGVSGVKAAEQLKSSIPVVVGAVLPSSFSNREMKWSGISLLPDPNLLFKTLLSFVPDIKTVLVVYNHRNNQFLIEKAIKTGLDLGIKVDARPVDDLRHAALVYRDLLATIDSRTNAVWLVRDVATLDSNLILPLILNQAWDRDLVVFSNNLIFAKRGALFSMYPDNLNMGKELAKLARAVLSDSSKSEFQVLRALKIAVNIRTAKHLGINFTATQEKSFDLIFPRNN